MFIAHEYTNLFLILEDIQKVYRDPKNGKQYWASKTFRKNKKFTLGGKKRIKFIIGTKDSIPLPDTSYSYVLCRKTLHEFSNKEKMIKELERIIKINGELVIVEAVPQSKGEIDEGCKKLHMTKEEILDYFKDLQFIESKTFESIKSKKYKNTVGYIGVYRFKKVIK